MITKLQSITFLGCLFFLLAFSLQAQEKTIEEILSVQLRNVGAIKNGNDVSGYYLFYETDKAAKDKRTYTLQILDEQLEEVSRKRMNLAKSVYLVEAAFNDSLIMFKFFDTTEDKYTFKAYNMNGERAKGGSRKLNKKTYTAPLSLQSKKGQNHNGAFFSVPRKGFIQYAGCKNKKWGYVIDFFGGSREKSWKYKSDKNADILLSTSHITATENIILANLVKSENGKAKKVTSALLALDVNTGEKVFETDFETDRPIEVVNGFIDEDKEEIVIFGLYFEEGAKTFKAKSRGLFAYSLDMKGNVKEQKYISWEEDVSEFVKMNKKGKMKGSEYIAFHDIVRTSDGKVLVLGEQYAKKIDGGAIATGAIIGAIASGVGLGSAYNNNSNFTKFVINDLMLFKFSKDFTLESVDVFEKGKSDIGLPSDGMKPQLLAYLARSMNAFDYSYTQIHEDHSAVTFTYLDYERRSGESNGYSFGAITYVDGEVATDKIKLDGGKNKWVRILSAVPGYVAIVEIETVKEKQKGLKLKKKKLHTLNMRLEKVNY